MRKESVEAVVHALNDAGVRYMIVGGLAVVMHGYRRFTDDLDLMIDLEHDNIFKGLNALASIGFKPSIPITAEQFSDPENRERWKSEKGMLVLNLHSDLHRETRLDVFTFIPFEFGPAYAKAKTFNLAPQTSATIIGLDELLLLKRLAGRPQDLADIAKLEKFRNV
jgi:predicted nucleotidyltransferase